LAVTMLCTVLASVWVPETVDRDLALPHDAVKGEAGTALPGKTVNA
jgi:hypothetical protein